MERGAELERDGVLLWKISPLPLSKRKGIKGIGFILFTTFYQTSKI
jgi:hypothetical protein